jgi:hypothetical protein
MIGYERMKPAKLTSEELRKLVYGLHGLHDDQRALIKATLEDLLRQHAEIWPEDLQRALRRLREEFKISEAEAKTVVSAIFP